MQKDRDILAKVFQMINDLKPYNSKSLREAVFQLRQFIRYHTLIDPYSGRSKWPSWEDRKGKIAVEIGTMGSHYASYLKADTIWPDNYVEWLRDPEKVVLHDKRKMFRLGDEYYDKDDYFLYCNKAYSKEEYVLYNGTPRKKTEVSLMYFYKWPPSGSAKKYEIALMPDVNEKFVKHSCQNDSDIQINIEVSSYNSKLFCTDFVKSMFLVGNERELPDYGYIYLSRAQLKQFKFKPSEGHLAEFMRLNNYYSKDIAYKEMVKLVNDAHFYIKQVGEVRSATSLKQKLLNAIVKRGRRGYSDSCVGLKELFIRLRAINKMYDVEAQYARQ